MLTKARIAGHPIHPMLVAFPVALYTVTVVALLVHAGTKDPFWFRAAMWTNIAGVVMAVVAAVPGLVDLMMLPARSKARATGLRHAGFNVLALVLFACSASLMYRDYTRGVNLEDGAPIALGLVGLASTIVAGWLGWTLVQTHHVGVKPTRLTSNYAPFDEQDDLDQLGIPPASTARYVDQTTIRH